VGGRRVAGVGVVAARREDARASAGLQMCRLAPRVGRHGCLRGPLCVLACEGRSSCGTYIVECDLKERELTRCFVGPSSSVTTSVALPPAPLGASASGRAGRPIGLMGAERQTVRSHRLTGTRTRRARAGRDMLPERAL